MKSGGFRLLLDQGLPRDAADQLRRSAVECTHVGEIGMSAAPDAEVLEYAAAKGCIVATLDGDFHTMLIVTGRPGPSVIQIRMEGLKGTAIASIIQDALTMYAADLANGCMTTVKKHKTTCHLLAPSE
jgi:predicted nuclease of predicted toxin-antitoxin system